MVQNPRKRYHYKKARFLRSRGFSYNHIRTELNVSKSSISLWCRNIKLSKKYLRLLENRSKKNIQRGTSANKIKREREIEDIKQFAKQEIRKLPKDAYKIAGTMLYWAEGAKTQSTAMSNADPRMITFMVGWFRTIFNIHPHQLKAHLHIHYGNDERKIKRYWSALTGIPLINFGKSFIKPRGTGHRTNILPNSVIKIRVRGAGTENLRHRILAWTEKIHELSEEKSKPPIAQLAEQRALNARVPGSSPGGGTT